MQKQIMEKRKEPRLPLNIMVKIKVPESSRYIDCKAINISLNGSLIHINKPFNLNKKMLFNIKEKYDEFETLCDVKWHKNENNHYKIGLEFEDAIDISIPFKKISNSILKWHKNLLNEKTSTYEGTELIKNYITHIHIGYLSLLFRNEMVEVLDDIEEHLTSVDFSIKKIIKMLNDISSSNFKNTYQCFFRHRDRITSELDKIKIYSSILDNELEEEQDIVGPIDVKSLTLEILNKFYKDMTNFKDIYMNYSMTNNIPIFLGDAYLFKKAIKIAFNFNINSILFYGTKNIHMGLGFNEKNKKLIIKITNNGSSIMDKNFYIDQDTLLSSSSKNSFIDLLKIIVILLKPYDPKIQLINESGKNQLIIICTIEPLININ